VGERPAHSTVTLAMLAALALAACRSEEPIANAPFVWPQGSRPVAEIVVADFGTVRVALYPELAPETVENFRKLADEGFYDGTTFHRVIPGFMIQGGDPNSRDKDPYNDGQGNPGYRIPDEFSRASHERGVVSMANEGRRDSGGSQFFIVHDDARTIDGRYTAFGRVIEGMDVVDAISEVERDELGRWGPEDRPIGNVVIERIRVHPLAATTGQPATPDA